MSGEISVIAMPVQIGSVNVSNNLFSRHDGDWGGPMVDNHGSLSGIASWAVGCGRQGFPAVYVNAIVVRDWICDIMSFDDD
ncbi:hypothetical protein SK128_018037 [Halocaridina rubra]|uniref:Peptidase S1 domain-containing protein n=1 Tax=Halocaridina rubra TaxID=373956 RepID=A0AAN8X9E9_HALRR